MITKYFKEVCRDAGEATVRPQVLKPGAVGEWASVRIMTQLWEGSELEL
jgi:hypothetical protein